MEPFLYTTDELTKVTKEVLINCRLSNIHPLYKSFVNFDEFCKTFGEIIHQLLELLISDIKLLYGVKYVSDFIREDIECFINSNKNINTYITTSLFRNKYQKIDNQILNLLQFIDLATHANVEYYRFIEQKANIVITIIYNLLNLSKKNIAKQYLSTITCKDVTNIIV